MSRSASCARVSWSWIDLNEIGGGDEAIDSIGYAVAEAVGGEVAKNDQGLLVSDCDEEGGAIGIERAPDAAGLQVEGKMNEKVSYLPGIDDRWESDI